MQRDAARNCSVMPPEIAAMLGHPGKHAVSDNRAWKLTGRYVIVEVTQLGECFQLTPAGQRDGALPPAGWASDAIVVDDLLSTEERKCLK